MKHACEPDHLAAVSTFVATERRTKSSVSFAAAWGMGHAAVLLGVGALLFSLRARMPEHLGDAFELLVAVMLVALGVRGLRRAKHERDHRVGGHEHTHEHAEASPKNTLLALPFVVGSLHGLAGSGALTAAIAAEQPTWGLGLLTMALYGGGAALGMMLLAAAVTLPLKATGKAAGRVLSTIGLVSSIASLVVGLAWAAPIVQRWV
jgi:cytochrome c biogenesis protein CcdA